MIKIHHLYVNPQNIKQSYRWKLRCPAMLLTLPSVWTVNTDSYIVENVFSIISGWSTRIQIYCSEKYRMTWDCQLQKEVNQLNARLRSQRVKTGHTESRFALKGSTSSVPLLGQCRIPQRPQREMLSCSDSLKNLSRPRRARPSMCEDSISWNWSAALFPHCSPSPSTAGCLWTASFTAGCACPRLDTHLPLLPPLSLC